MPAECLHHLQGKFINDPQVLLEAAQLAGVQGAEGYLSSDAGRSEVLCALVTAHCIWWASSACLAPRDEIWWAHVACEHPLRELEQACSPQLLLPASPHMWRRSRSFSVQLTSPWNLRACLLQVLQDIQERAHGITGVPNFTINGQYVLSGAQVGSGCLLLASWPLMPSGMPSGS